MTNRQKPSFKGSNLSRNKIFGVEFGADSRFLEIVLRTYDRE